MENMMDIGEQFLDDMLKEHASEIVKYRQKGVSMFKSVSAVVGGTFFSSADVTGFPVKARSTDFIIGVLELGVEPQKGDTIVRNGELFEVYRAALRDHGLEIEPLHFSRSRVMTMAYRPRLVEDVLSDPRNRAFLARSGYCVDGAEGLVRSMRLRLLAFYQTREKDARTCSKAAAHGFPASSEQGFPHEMGLLFGYPLEDVRGFISGGKATCRGAWISYGDVAKSRRRFEALSRIERECRGRYRAGATLGALLESA